MIDGQKATLPENPNDAWQKFSDAYDALPTKKTDVGRIKKANAHSSYLTNGVIISSTFSEKEEVGRVSIDVEDGKSLNSDIVTQLIGMGWEFLRQGTERLVFRKTLALENSKSTMHRALPLILQRLGVEPNQDWGN
jgi:hypothetical protein